MFVEQGPPRHSRRTAHTAPMPPAGGSVQPQCCTPPVPFQLTSQERPCHSKSEEVSPAGRRRRFLPGSGPTSHLREALRHGQLWLSLQLALTCSTFPSGQGGPCSSSRTASSPPPHAPWKHCKGTRTDEALPRPLLPSPPPDPFPSEGLPITGCCLAVQDPQDSNHCRLPIQGEQAFSLSVSETGTEEGLACPPCYPKEAHVSQN